MPRIPGLGISGYVSQLSACLEHCHFLRLLPLRLCPLPRPPPSPPSPPRPPHAPRPPPPYLLLLPPPPPFLLRLPLRLPFLPSPLPLVPLLCLSLPPPCPPQWR